MKIKSQARLSEKSRRFLWKRHKYLYVMLIPALAFLFIFSYLPMYGIIFAFQDYNPRLGFASAFVGFKHFQRLFSDIFFQRAFFNTLIINIYKLVFEFPMPIILALLMNEIRKNMVKRVIQTITYMPHFLSWVIVGGYLMNILSPNDGIIAVISEFFTGTKSDTYLLISSKYFRGIVVSSSVWKEIGWSSIIYMAAISSVDPTLYEAAVCDGAGKIRQLWNITLPCIFPTIAVMLILRIGHMMGSDFEQLFVLGNPNVYSVGDVIATYVYRVGLRGMAYSYGTAVGCTLSVIGFILLASANKLSKKFLETTFW